MKASEYWDKIANKYNGLYLSKWSQEENKQVQAWLTSLNLEMPNLLDLGCGTALGLEISDIIPLASYTGIDISPNMLQEAKSSWAVKKASFPISLINGQAITIMRSMPDSHYDLIIGINASPSYIARTRPLLIEGERILKPGGSMVLSFLNHWSLRRYLLRQTNIREPNKSRGLEEESLQISAITLTKKEITYRLPKNTHIQEINFQSVLGGVWESSASTYIEKLLSRIVPFWGHTINFIIKKEAEHDESVETLYRN